MKPQYFLKYIALGLILVTVLGAASCGKKTSSTGGKVTIENREPVVLEYLRLWDESDSLDKIVKAYQTKHPNVQIIVKKATLRPDQTIYDYQKDVIKQIADGKGPDIFEIHNDWLPYQKNQISPMPSAILTPAGFKDKFYEVTYNDFVADNQVYAIPFYIDNLMLYYNPDLLKKAKIKTPPKTWQELVDMIPKLTKIGANNTIIQSAIPLGTANTIDIPRFAEILATLMMQYGAQMTSDDQTKATFDLPAPYSNPPYFSAQEALAFYTSFANPKSPNYTYTDAKNPDGTNKFPSDVQSFMEGKSAMMLGYAYQINQIKQFAPKLYFETAPAPQLRVDNQAVTANYWGETVSKNCKYPNVAWDFLNFATTSANPSYFFRATNHVPAVKSTYTAYASRQYYGPVVKQAEISKSWYRKNSSDIETIFAQMINNILHNNVAIATAIDIAVRDINKL